MRKIFSPDRSDLPSSAENVEPLQFAKIACHHSKLARSSSCEFLQNFVARYFRSRHVRPGRLEFLLHISTISSSQARSKE